jgi:hypothetical protein
MILTGRVFLCYGYPEKRDLGLTIEHESVEIRIAML